MSKHEKRKPRNQRVGGTTRDEVDSATILVNRRTGKIYFETPVVNTYSEVACDRAKGEKILSRISVPLEDLEADPNAAMFANFDLVFSADTNTWTLGERQVSVTGIIEARKIFLGDETGIAEPSWGYTTPVCFAFGGSRDAPERAGWFLATDFIQNSPEYRQYRRIALIVDHDLAHIDEYNARTRPIAGDVFLPKGFSLVYASCDQGGEYFANQMLRHADRVATFAWKKSRTGPYRSSKRI
jgi:hypothetical protein